MSRHAWIDASAGVAGDMLLGALVDAGADLIAVQTCVDAVVPGAVRLTARPVLRAGQSATLVDVEVVTDDLPERHWSEIEAMLARADLPGPVHERANRTFARLAEAEAAVHGIAVAQVHFHEVGALDSIADVVGVCAALHLLGVETLSAGPVAVGSGRIRSAHGDIAVPVPAVVRLSTGWRVLAGGRGELATPTGMALVTALSERCEDLPALVLSSAGSGAGTKDDPERANLTRVLVGELAPGATAGSAAETLTVLEANVDDLDPRLWPGVLARLLAAGALDAWLVPILMKKGRPAHTLAVLARPADADRLEQLVFAETTTLGVRRATWLRTALDRGWADVRLEGEGEGGGGTVAVKVASRQGLVVSATPEFADVERLAAGTGAPVRSVLERAVTAATAAGLTGGAPLPPGLRDAAERADAASGRAAHERPGPAEDPPFG